jgi:hypothetical protein
MRLDHDVNCNYMQDALLKVKVYHISLNLNYNNTIIIYCSTNTYYYWHIWIEMKLLQTRSEINTPLTGNILHLWALSCGTGPDFWIHGRPFNQIGPMWMQQPDWTWFNDQNSSTLLPMTLLVCMRVVCSLLMMFYVCLNYPLPAQCAHMKPNAEV